VAFPPPAAHFRFKAPQATGASDTRYTNKKNIKDDILLNFKNLPQKLSQAADEIFRVATWTRSELAVSLRLWVGQVDAEKLAQRSSVAT
jgi:hypothetical protein